MSAIATPRSDSLDPPPPRHTRALRAVSAGGLQVAEKFYFPDRFIPRHFHTFSNLTFVIAGALDESAGSTREVGRPGSWVMKPAGVEHANRVGRHGARVLEIRFTGERAGPSFGYSWRHGGPEAVTFLRIFGELRRGGPEAAPIVAGMLGGLFAAGGDRPPGPAWIEAVRDRLHDAAGPSPSLRTLAGEFRVHPTYLARAFRRRYGRSIGEYVRGLRVEAVSRSIARRGDTPLSSIALDAGFADQSHMTRAFGAETGMTPGAYRTMIRDGDTA